MNGGAREGLAMAAPPLPLSDLPAELSIFPLTGALLLPGGQLPLNIFEPRYLNMFRDAMATPQRLIGMVQAATDQQDMGAGDLYGVGCAGRLSAFSETDDGRYLVGLSGLIRFEILEELPLHEGGYRRVRPGFATYARDLTPTTPILSDGRRAGFVKQMRAYFRAQGFDTDWDAVETAPMDDLVTSLAMACPFSAAEKQAVLEAPDFKARFNTLEGLLAIGALEEPDQKRPQKH